MAGIPDVTNKLEEKNAANKNNDINLYIGHT
jgi:hypothetical protein